eukprot:8653857-Alexandrium_andersonii.AAC.1
MAPLAAAASAPDAGRKPGIAETARGPRRASVRCSGAAGRPRSGYFDGPVAGVASAAWCRASQLSYRSPGFPRRRRPPSPPSAAARRRSSLALRLQHVAGASGSSGA